MLNPMGRAGSAVISPLWKGNEPTSAEANWKQLEILLGSVRRFPGAVTIQLPSGQFYVGSSGTALVTLDEFAAGLVIRNRSLLHY
jgi:hypothetical protein